MAIEFTCPGCQSRHACADHMVGRQFKCGGCGKILEVPATSAADSAPRRRVAADNEDHPEERGGMGAGLQVTLLIGGGIALLVFFLFCMGGGAILLLFQRPLPNNELEQGVMEKEVGVERTQKTVEPPPKLDPAPVAK